MSLWYFIEENALARGEREGIWSRDGRYTWTELYARSNQYAHWFLAQGVRPGPCALSEDQLGKADGRIWRT